MSSRSLGAGYLHRFESSDLTFHASWDLGCIEGLRRFVALCRQEPFWMRPKFGTEESQIPADTQWLLAEREDGTFTLYAPLIDDRFRASLHGSENGLALHVDSGDPAVVATEFDALYTIEGTDLHDMARTGAHEVAAHLGIPLRDAKPTPSFVDDFGWCTWDAFYRDVTPAGVRQGLEALRAEGITPGFVILDDGWLSTRVGAHREEILTSFSANPSFGGDLAPTIRLVKDEFGVRTFIVWHAVNGYWGGVDADNFSRYDVRSVVRRFAPGILAGVGPDPWWVGGTFQGPTPTGFGITWVVPPSAIARFYNDFHRGLLEQGVDGLKVDNQAALEGLGEGMGGRMNLMRKYREALEGSAQAHFGGNLINCMSCSTDMLYSSRASNVVRSSDDFYPNNPETHGRHVVTNAIFGLWFGQFLLPDWDMFHSSHPAGKFHAAARAISGGPIYVSDKPGSHDYDLIRGLILADGHTARPLAPAIPTADSALVDAMAGEGAFKVFAPNASNWIVGAFHCQFGPESTKICGHVGSDDVPDLRGKQTLFYVDGALHHGPVTFELSALEHCLVTVCEVIDGFAAIGLTRLLNPGGGIGKSWRDGDAFYVEIRAGGELLAYSVHRPRTVEIRADGDWKGLDFDWNFAAVRLAIPEGLDRALVAIRR